MQPRACILSVGVATPTVSYTQEEIVKKLGIDNRRTKQLFEATRIKKRYLHLSDNIEYLDEPQDILINRHEDGCLLIGEEAINKALKKAKIDIEDVNYICVVTSTGFMLPAISARLIKKMNIKPEIQRADIVGMGCNGGLNGLNTVNNWAIANPSQYALLLCVEICSAMYVNDGSLRSNVVNSLFGDGAAAVVVRYEPKNSDLSSNEAPRIHGFSSFIITDALEAMQVIWNERVNKFSFELHHSNPYVVGKYINKPIENILKKYQLNLRDISHWIVHGGGRNVISAVKMNLGLSTHDMRHTISVLMDYGNVSSSSFLFSYSRLLDENVINKGDWGLMITIGPGAQLETALLEW